MEKDGEEVTVVAKGERGNLKEGWRATIYLATVRIAREMAWGVGRHQGLHEERVQGELRLL